MALDIEAKYKFSSDCASCWGNLAGCVSASCSNNCNDQASCMACIGTFCLDGFNTCLGMAPISKYDLTQSEAVEIRAQDARRR